MRYEFHAHSNYSRGTKILWDGISSVDEIIKTAKLLNLDGIAITDHNTVLGLRKAKIQAAKHGLLLIPGIEISTLNGHVIGLGIEERIRPRMSIQESIDEIHSHGGISIAPHPFDVPRQGSGRLSKYCDAIEVFNALRLDRFANRKAKNYAKKTGMPCVVGSDAHSSSMIGNCVNIINADSVDSVLKNVKGGKAKFRTSYTSVDDIIDWSRTALARSYEDVINYVNLNWSKPKGAVGKFVLRKFVGGSGRNAWKTLAYILLGTAIVYSGVRSNRIFEFLEYE